MPFTSLVAPRHFEAMIRLVGEVRFAQAAEAAESVQWRPPKAAIGSSGSDSDRIRRTEQQANELFAIRYINELPKSAEELLRLISFVTRSKGGY